MTPQKNEPGRRFTPFYYGLFACFGEASLEGGMRLLHNNLSGLAGADKHPIVVIGNGMVSHRFCRAFRERESTFPLVVLGGESVPAYDRVNLSRLSRQPDREMLFLDRESWYEETHIDLRLGVLAVSVDVERRQVYCSDGLCISYSALVLASGSIPWVPYIEGASGAKTFVYRSMEDVERIRAAAGEYRQAAVIGGGLLGLEAAKAIHDLGVSVQVLELADFLMPQQLDFEGGLLLKQEVSQLGITVRTSCQTLAIEDEESFRVLHLRGGQSLRCDFVVIAAGIRPATAFLENSGVERNAHGAITVNTQLETNIPDVYAIGECAGVNGKVYGLVRPGYEMADVLASRLSGGKRVFREPDLSTRLKVVDVHVAALGDFLQAEMFSESVRFSRLQPRGGSVYRKLIVRGNRLIGLIAVGEWNGLPAAEEAIGRRARISARQLRLFRETGEIFEATSQPAVLGWSDEIQICNCMSVNKGMITAAISCGCLTVEEVGQKTFAGTVCGSCQPLLSELIHAKPVTAPVPLSVLVVLGTSLISFAGILLAVLVGPIKYMDSVEAYGYKVEELWRSGLLKQISGYTLLCLSVFAATLSLRKRFQQLKFGRYAIWRATHTVTGLLILALLFIHTGFRLGYNFNAWLMVAFGLLNLMGGLTGIFSGLEARTNSRVGAISRRLKPAAGVAHIALFWPIPLLVVFHILSVYYW